MDSSHIRTILIAGSIVLAFLVLATQIDKAGQLSVTEASLYGVLQFIFSVGFSYLITARISEQSFRDSQRQFALGAFRRIKEIERAISRAQAVLSARKNESKGEMESTALISLLSAQDAVNSSIADWSDIIGNEIELTREIERIRSQRAGAEKLEREVIDNMLRQPEKEDTWLRDLSAHENRIETLRSELPNSLRTEVSLDDDDGHTDETIDVFRYLAQNYLNKGYLEFSAFYDSADSFYEVPEEFVVGGKASIARGITNRRGSSLLVYDSQNNWIGVVTNALASFEVGYDEFVDYIDDFFGLKCLVPPQFGGEGLPVTITEINEGMSEGRRHMRLRLLAQGVPNDVDLLIRETFLNIE